MRVFIELDVSLAKTAICVVDRDGAVQWQGKIPSEPGPLIKRSTRWLGNIELAGIEACPLSEWLHLGLTPRVYQSGEIERSGQISKCFSTRPHRR
jgi:transposase